MKQYLTILILILSFQNILCQVNKAVIVLETDSEKDTISIIKISETKTHYSKADLTPWTILKDSGEYNEQNYKYGFWKEYPIDTLILYSEKNIRKLSAISEVYEPEIIRHERNYKNGNKVGVWKEYNANIRMEPFFWNLNKTCEYADNMKNGKEVWFEPFSTDTMMIFIYKNDEPIKQIK